MIHRDQFTANNKKNFYENFKLFKTTMSYSKAKLVRYYMKEAGKIRLIQGSKQLFPFKCSIDDYWQKERTKLSLC